MNAIEAFEANCHRFSYNPETGEVFRDGVLMNGTDREGYGRVYVSKTHLLAHRVAWRLHYGEWPKNQIDHINGIVDDNRIGNLRDVCPSLNRMNQALRSDNTSGVVGVYLRQNGRWTAAVTAFGKRRNLGSFENKASAIRARKTAQSQMGFGPHHGEAQR